MFEWTVYFGETLFDLWSESEVRAMMREFDPVFVHWDKKLIEF